MCSHLMLDSLLDITSGAGTSKEISILTGLSLREEQIESPAEAAR
jgi:hypothetical protein